MVIAFVVILVPVQSLSCPLVRYLSYIPPSHVFNVQELIENIESKKAKMEYLPRYSPDFSPISFTFTDIKTIVKKSM
jgi:transposase